MTTPESNDPDDRYQNSEGDVPAVNPAYSTPPADGLPDAETD
ncbi:hypothetical protein [Mycolicibacterium lacusdiani]|nr:hypothetical protein [Mycolicibacterium lacusdiani]